MCTSNYCTEVKSLFFYRNILISFSAHNIFSLLSSSPYFFFSFLSRLFLQFSITNILFLPFPFLFFHPLSSRSNTIIPISASSLFLFLPLTFFLTFPTTIVSPPSILPFSHPPPSLLSFFFYPWHSFSPFLPLLFLPLIFYLSHIPPSLTPPLLYLSNFLPLFLLLFRNITKSLIKVLFC